MVVEGWEMITFRDTTYCASDCTNQDCPRHKSQEMKDRERLPGLAEIPTAWCEFSHDCPDYKAPER